ncbi:hypothetical protein TcWFU_003671 [Taenia crassiceps]|uniref:Uncharacterized protein n=1 Tax=Taenia crassiceps TaxID=6207 RepID=A0ABR4Q751_9CEST
MSDNRYCSKHKITLHLDPGGNRNAEACYRRRCEFPPLLYSLQLDYLISVTAHSLSEICRLSSNTDFKSKVSALLKVPIRDVENEISNILSTIWVHNKSAMKALQAKRRKILSNFGAADFDTLFEDVD